MCHFKMRERVLMSTKRVVITLPVVATEIYYTKQKKRMRQNYP